MEARVRKAAGVSSAAQAKRMDALLRQDALQRRDAAYTRAWRDLLEDAAARYPGYKVESAAGNGAYLPIGMRADRFSSAEVAYTEDTDDDGYTFRTPAQEDATFGWIHGGRTLPHRAAPWPRRRAVPCWTRACCGASAATSTPPCILVARVMSWLRT